MRPLPSGLAALGLAVAAAAQDDGRAASLHAHLDRLEALGFSGAAGVQRGGEVLVERAVGCADLEAGRPFTVDTGFFVASLSKAFTAALVLALQQRGRLRVADPIGEHADGLPDALAAVTVHQLLSHTSGLLRLDPERSADGAAVLAAAGRAGLEFEPGTRFDYSNAGYAVLAAIAERAGGAPYERLLRELVLEPAGMAATSVVTERARWDGRPLAIGYQGLLPQGDALLVREYGRELIGPAGVVTTSADMLRWELALRGDAVLDAAARRAMFTPVRDGYGYGWSIWRSDRAHGLVAAHDGHVLPEGFNAYHVRLLDADAGVVVLSNRGDLALAERVAWQLVDILVGNPPPPLPELAKSATPPPTGRLRSSAGSEIDARALGNHVYLVPQDQAAADLFLAPATVPAAATRRIADLLAHPKDAPAVLRETVAAAATQSARFGPLQANEVLYSVQEDGFVRTHLRHRFARGTAFTRLDSIGDELVGGTDAGAFVSGGQGLTPTLAGLCLAPVGEGVWIAWDFWAQRGTTVRREGESLVVGEGEGAVHYGASGR